MSEQHTEDLAHAIVIASKAHMHQKDKSGAPYVLHPLRIMFRLPDTEARIVAALHDVIEDSEITLPDLRARGFSEPVVAAVDALSRREAEPYDDYIERVAANPLAARVKVEDLRDNLDLTRINNLTQDGVERVRRYHKALARLQPLVEIAAD